MRRDIAAGDIVLLKDKAAYRNDWKMGRVNEGIKSKEGKVRKTSVLVVEDGEKKMKLRPITDLVLLVPTRPDGPVTEGVEEEKKAWQ